MSLPAATHEGQSIKGLQNYMVFTRNSKKIQPMGILLMHEFEESGRKRQGENVRWMRSIIVHDEIWVN